MSSVYLFQKDLRLNDNNVLNKALNQSSEVYFTFVLPAELKDNSNANSYISTIQGELGFPVWSDLRKKLVFSALSSLKNEIFKHGHEFLIFKDYYDWSKFLTFVKCKRLFTQKSPFKYENEFKNHISSSTEVVCEYNDRLIDFNVIPYIFSRFDSFTKFRKQVENHNWPLMGVNEQIEISNSFKSINQSNDLSLNTKQINESRLKIFDQTLTEALVSEAELQSYLKKFDNVQLAFDFKTDKLFLEQHLQNYIWNKKHILHYKQTRNGLVKFYDSSKFSIGLSFGLYSPLEIFKNVVAFEDQFRSNSSTYWLKFELLWRDYFKMISDQVGDQLFYSKGLCEENKSYYSKSDFDQKIKIFKKWTDGKTTHPFINANMNELRQTGWMSNRGRQNVASYLVHELKLPWIWGAQWFESNLLDYDPASNYGNWQYIAGVGGWGEHKFDYDWQQKTYDPEGEYVKLWS